MSELSISVDEQSEALVESLPLRGAIVTAEGDFVDVLGRPRSGPSDIWDTAIVGQSLTDVFSSATAAELQGCIERATETGDVQTITFEVSSGPGLRYYQSHISPVPMGDESGSYCILVAEDVTEQQAQQEQLQRFEKVVEAANVAIYVTDAEGQIEYVNPAFEEITGFESNEAIGESPAILQSGQMREDYYDALWGNLETGQPWEERIINRRKDGDLYYAYQTIAPITDSDGATKAYVAIQRDITEQVQLNQEQQRQHEHLARTEDLAAVGGWEYIPATETFRWTEGARQLFEVPTTFDPTIDEIFEFFHPNDRATIKDGFEECIESGIEYSMEARIITNKGRQRWVHAKGERVNDEGETKLFGILQDITAQKMDEQRLMVLNRVLRHNLRNKLNVILGIAEVLERRNERDSADLFAHLEASVNDLLSLASKSRQSNQILEYEFAAEAVELDALISELCEEFEEIHSEATFAADDLSGTVSANETGLRLLFDELIENAVKHNDRPNPTVSITTEARSEQRVDIIVADNGNELPGMEREVLESGKETALIHSDGIGLWTVNWLVTKLSGGISVDSNSPDGTSIRVTLPTVEADS